MSESDDMLRGAIEVLREPVERRPDALDEVVQSALNGRTTVWPVDGSSGTGRWARLEQGRLILSPLVAACWTLLVVASVASVVTLRARSTASVAATAVDLVRHQFVLVAPEAESVSLVGDFNGWQIGATPLARQGDAWTIEMPVQPGRHVYSFVVDGSEWIADATAARAAEDDFGRPSSVLIVGPRGS
jgi:hypothetical protein